MDNKEILYHNSLSEIKYEIVDLNHNDLIEKGFKEIPKDSDGNLFMIMQYLPGQIAQGLTKKAGDKAVEELSKNAYRVVIGDGLHLAESKAKKGAFRGLAYDKSNHLKEHAELIPISPEGVKIPINPQIVLGVYNALSFATGQYFLSEINGKLGDIEQGVAEIQHFLETDKKSEILADERTILNIYRELQYILQNDLERHATSVELKRIKDKALKNIYFFDEKIRFAAKEIQPKRKKETVEQYVGEFEKYLPQYYCAMRNYFNAKALDTIVMEMDNPKYLDDIKNDLNGVLDQYKQTCKLCDDKMMSYIEKSKELNKKKVLPEDISKVVNYIPIYGVPGLVTRLAAIGFEGLDTYNEYSSKQKKKDMIKKKDSLWDIISDYTTAEESIRTVEEYKKMRNNPIELVLTEENAYIKYDNVEE